MGAVERLLQMRRVEPRRVARAPRQRHDHPRSVQHLLDRLGLRRECPPECAPQRLRDRVGQSRLVDGPDHLLGARAGRDQRAHRLECRPGGPAATRRRRGLGGRFVHGRRPARALAQQAQRLPLVGYTHPARGRQVGKAPPVALRAGGDHVAAVSAPVRLQACVRVAAPGRAARTLERGRRTAVLVDRRRVEQEQNAVVVPPEQLRAHLLYVPLPSLLLIHDKLSTSRDK